MHLVPKEKTYSTKHPIQLLLMDKILEQLSFWKEFNKEARHPEKFKCRKEAGTLLLEYQEQEFGKGKKGEILMARKLLENGWPPTGIPEYKLLNSKDEESIAKSIRNWKNNFVIINIPALAYYLKIDERVLIPDFLIEPYDKYEVEKNEQKSSFWKACIVNGNTFLTKKGAVSTKKARNSCPSGWFGSDETVILGVGDDTYNNNPSSTKGEWSIPLKYRNFDNLERGYLVIGCLRPFGGLHTSHFGANTKVIFNNEYIDDFDLMVIPEKHTDYFHRPPTLKFPDFPPISDCLTLYTWPLPKSRFNSDKYQIVGIEIDANVSWDVDYVGIICSFRS